MNVSTSHSYDLSQRLCKIAEELTVAAKKGDLERIAQLDVTLKSCAIELIATLDIMSDDADHAMAAIEHALFSVHRVAEIIVENRNTLTKRVRSDRQLRLVYSQV